MEGSLIAQRYAKALFDLSLEMNVVEETRADMELINAVCHANAELIQLLKSPVIRADKKQKVINAIFEGKISKLSMRYLDIITRKKREIYIPGIAREYLKDYKKFKNIITVHFTSATAINDSIRKKVVDLLEKQTSSTVELLEDVKKELIGGFVLNYNNYKYDASIAYQLKKLRKQSAEVNLYIREI